MRAGLSILLLLSLAGILAAQNKRSPMTFQLNCPGGDCPLLTGAPQTHGVRGGAVKLKPGESVGEHSTNDNEEVLVILRGNGTAKIEGQAPVALHEKTPAYIPPKTKHNVSNTGPEVLEYVWVVSPTRKD